MAKRSLLREYETALLFVQLELNTHPDERDPHQTQERLLALEHIRIDIQHELEVAREFREDMAKKSPGRATLESIDQGVRLLRKDIHLWIKKTDTAIGDIRTIDSKVSKLEKKFDKEVAELKRRVSALEPAHPAPSPPKTDHSPTSDG